MLYLHLYRACKFFPEMNCHIFFKINSSIWLFIIKKKQKKIWENVKIENFVIKLPFANQHFILIPFLTYFYFLLNFSKAIIALKKGAHLLKCGKRGKPKLCPFRLSTVRNFEPYLIMCYFFIFNLGIYTFMLQITFSILMIQFFSNVVSGWKIVSLVLGR